VTPATASSASASGPRPRSSGASSSPTFARLVPLSSSWVPPRTCWPSSW